MSLNTRRYVHLNGANYLKYGIIMKRKEALGETDWNNITKYHNDILKNVFERTQSSNKQNIKKELENIMNTVFDPNINKQEVLDFREELERKLQNLFNNYTLKVDWSTGKVSDYGTNFRKAAKKFEYALNKSDKKTRVRVSSIIEAYNQAMNIANHLRQTGYPNQTAIANEIQKIYAAYQTMLVDFQKLQNQNGQINKKYIKTDNKNLQTFATVINELKELVGYPVSGAGGALLEFAIQYGGGIGTQNILSLLAQGTTQGSASSSVTIDFNSNIDNFDINANGGIGQITWQQTSKTDAIIRVGQEDIPINIKNYNLFAAKGYGIKTVEETTLAALLSESMKNAIYYHTLNIFAEHNDYDIRDSYEAIKLRQTVAILMVWKSLTGVLANKASVFLVNNNNSSAVKGKSYNYHIFDISELMLKIVNDIEQGTEASSLFKISVNGKGRLKDIQLKNNYEPQNSNDKNGQQAAIKRRITKLITDTQAQKISISLYPKALDEKIYGSP